MRWADRREAFPVALIDDAGQAVEPTKANILNGTYPLARPIVVVFPRGAGGEQEEAVRLPRQ
ncbi:MAG: hypothetical protein WDN28_02560 [Chthoniobacter sp.]